MLLESRYLPSNRRSNKSTGINARRLPLLTKTLCFRSFEISRHRGICGNLWNDLYVAYDAYRHDRDHDDHALRDLRTEDHSDHGRSVEVAFVRSYVAPNRTGHRHHRTHRTHHRMDRSDCEDRKDRWPKTRDHHHLHHRRLHRTWRDCSDLLYVYGASFLDTRVDGSHRSYTAVCDEVVDGTVQSPWGLAPCGSYHIDNDLGRIHNRRSGAPR